VPAYGTDSVLTTTKLFPSLAGALLICTAVAACSPLRILNALTPGDDHIKTADVSYGDDPRNQLDVYAPKPAGINLPVVVFFYGGSWNNGSRKNYDFVGEALASRGIVVVIADYRVYPQVRYPAFVEDGARAVAWAASHIAMYGGDPKRMFVMGHSAGAYNAAMVALDPKYLKAFGMRPSDLRGWIGLSGPYNFLPIEDKAVRPVFFYPDSPPSSQPINHVSVESPRALLIAAAKDKVVDPEKNTGALAEKLRAAGVPVQEQYYDGVSHATLVGAMALPLRGLAPVLDRVVAYVMSDAGRIDPAPVSGGGKQ
jgi:acetyl esterase/lipase